MGIKKQTKEKLGGFFGGNKKQEASKETKTSFWNEKLETSLFVLAKGRSTDHQSHITIPLQTLIYGLFQKIELEKVVSKNMR